MKQRHMHIDGSSENGRGCPFCDIDPGRIFAANDLAYAVLDLYPVTPGHTLVIPKRHMGSIFEATEEERGALFDLLAEARRWLLNNPQPSFDLAGPLRVPDGFNIGINDGHAAGQTVMHLHIHLIPRYAGDCDDPRGGVRWVTPERAPYWKKL
jgi:diadenosine tetraphosphate (Ap4A) HIT family hydrolase